MPNVVRVTIWRQIYGLSIGKSEVEKNGHLPHRHLPRRQEGFASESRNGRLRRRLQVWQKSVDFKNFSNTTVNKLVSKKLK